jgi:hypothetical protein
MDSVVGVKGHGTKSKEKLHFINDRIRRGCFGQHVCV